MNWWWCFSTRHVRLEASWGKLRKKMLSLETKGHLLILFIYFQTPTACFVATCELWFVKYGLRGLFLRATHMRCRAFTAQLWASPLYLIDRSCWLTSRLRSPGSPYSTGSAFWPVLLSWNTCACTRGWFQLPRRWVEITIVGRTLNRHILW